MPPSDQPQGDNVISLPAPVMERATLVPLQPRDQEEAAAYPARIAELQQLAGEDNHAVLAATHVMVKGGKVVGYLSLGALPCVHAWFDTKNKHATDSLKMIEHGETIFREKGVRAYTVACAETSPFTPHMERMGFEKLGVTTLWRKRI